MTHRHLAFLFSILATGCATPAGDPPAPESEPDPHLAADSGPTADSAIADSATEIAEEDTDAIAPMDGAGSDTADAVVDAAPPPKPAWDACDVVPTGDLVPTQLAKTFLTEDGASSLIVHGDRLLFVTGWNEIDMVKTTPGSAFSLLMDSSIYAVATNGTDVVFSRSSGFGRTDFVGSDADYFGSHAAAFAIDEAYAYYTWKGGAADGSEDWLYRVPIGGSGAGTQIASGYLGSGIAVDDSGLFLGSTYTPPLETPTLTILRTDTAATSISALASREGFRDSWLALTPTHVVVFAEGATNEIFTVRKSDGKVQTLATVAKGSFDREIHVDETYAYWLELHQIRRVRLDGSKPAETIFRGACKPVSMTVDSKRIYFLTSPEKYGKDKGTTTAWSMEKPAG